MNKRVKYLKKDLRELFSTYQISLDSCETYDDVIREYDTLTIQLDSKRRSIKENRDLWEFSDERNNE